MPSTWLIVFSGSAGAVVSLLGVFAGAILTRRTEKQHWSRDKQIEACTDVIREATRIHRSLYRHLNHGEHTDWVPWNQALAAIWLLGDVDLINAAARIDETFFRTNTDIDRGNIKDFPTWRPMRDTMESDRLNFINVARKRVLLNGPVSRGLVARTTMTPDQPGNAYPAERPETGPPTASQRADTHTTAEGQGPT